MNRIANEITSELRRGKTTTALWQIKNWNTADALDFDILKRKSNCFVDILPGSTTDGSEEHFNSRLRFYFEEDIQRKSEGDDDYDTRYNYTEEHVWLKLCVSQLSNSEDRILQYEFQVDQVDNKLETVSGGVSVNKSRKEFFANYRGMEPVVLHDAFIHLQEKIRQEDSISDATPATVFPRPATLRLKLSVTPIFISGQSGCDDGLQVAKAGGEKSLCEDIKKILTFDETYADIMLETKDEEQVGAHKCILAARSPVLRSLIEKKADTNGVLKLPNVNSYPMAAILHWMYSGELHENTGKVMEEVVDAAIKFELTGLLKMMDRKMITICNKCNMFQLYQVAEKNGMMIAAENISKFIKESI